MLRSDFYFEMEFLMLSTEEIESSVTVRLSSLQWGICYYSRQTRFWEESLLKVLIEFLRLTGAAPSQRARDSRAVILGSTVDQGTKTWDLEDGQKDRIKQSSADKLYKSVLTTKCNKNKYTACIGQTRRAQYLGLGQMSFLKARF